MPGGAERLAIIIWVIAGLIGVVTLSSQKARSGVGRFFAALGRGLGWLMGVVLLTPLFLIGFTAAHIIGRLAGRDPLHLRDSESQTFWLPSIRIAARCDTCGRYLPLRRLYRRAAGALLRRSRS